MTPSITAVLGVVGRTTLIDMLRSLERNMGPDDQTIVVVDSFAQGDRPDVHDLVRSFGDRFECYAYDSGYNFLGVEQVNFAIRTVPMRGTHFISLADDDVLVDGAYAAYREFAARDMTRPLLPRFVPPWHPNPGTELLWDIPRMQIARITGAMVVPMAVLQQIPTERDCCVDYHWMANILKTSPPPVWLDFVSIIAKPPTRGSDVAHQGVWSCDACKRWGFVEDSPSLRCIHCGSQARMAPREVVAL